MRTLRFLLSLSALLINSCAVDALQNLSSSHKITSGSTSLAATSVDKKSDIFGLVSDTLWFASSTSKTPPKVVDPYIRHLQESAKHLSETVPTSGIPINAFDGNQPDSRGMVGVNQTAPIFDPGSQRILITAESILRNDLSIVDKIWPALDTFFSYQVEDGHIPYNGTQRALGMVALGEIFAFMGSVVGPVGVCDGLLLLENSRFGPNYAKKISDVRTKTYKMFKNMVYGTLALQGGKPETQIYWLDALNYNNTNRLAASAKTLDACAKFLESTDPILANDMRKAAQNEITATLNLQNLNTQSTVFGSYFESGGPLHDVELLIGATNADVSYSNVTLGFLLQYFYFNFGGIPSEYANGIDYVANYILDRIASDGTVYIGDSSRCGSLEDGTHIKQANFREMGLNLAMYKAYTGKKFDSKLPGKVFIKYTQSADISFFPAMNAEYSSLYQ